jgi:hypothetical protein
MSENLVSIGEATCYVLSEIQRKGYSVSYKFTNTYNKNTTIEMFKFLLNGTELFPYFQRLLIDHAIYHIKTRNFNKAIGILENDNQHIHIYDNFIRHIYVIFRRIYKLQFTVSFTMPNQSEQICYDSVLENFKFKDPSPCSDII